MTPHECIFVGIFLLPDAMFTFVWDFIHRLMIANEEKAQDDDVGQ